MSEIRTVTLKKSVLGSLKAMGENNTKIAERYGITSSEVNDAMVEFGFTKSKKKVNKKGYVVLHEDDVTVPETVTQTNLIDAIEETEEDMTQPEPTYVEDAYEGGVDVSEDTWTTDI